MAGRDDGREGGAAAALGAGDRGAEQTGPAEGGDGFDGEALIAVDGIGVRGGDGAGDMARLGFERGGFERGGFERGGFEREGGEGEVVGRYGVPPWSWRTAWAIAAMEAKVRRLR